MFGLFLLYMVKDMDKEKENDNDIHNYKDNHNYKDIDNNKGHLENTLNPRYF